MQRAQAGTAQPRVAERGRPRASLQEAKRASGRAEVARAKAPASAISGHAPAARPGRGNAAGGTSLQQPSRPREAAAPAGPAARRGGEAEEGQAALVDTGLALAPHRAETGAEPRGRRAAAEVECRWPYPKTQGPVEAGAEARRTLFPEGLGPRLPPEARAARLSAVASKPSCSRTVEPLVARVAEARTSSTGRRGRMSWREADRRLVAGWRRERAATER